MAMRRKIVVIILLTILVVLVGLGCLKWRKSLKRERMRRPFANLPVGYAFPPKDYSAWLAECGVNEPDPTTPEGRARLRDEQLRLPAAQKEFQRLLGTLPFVYTNVADDVKKDFLEPAGRLLDGFCRESCENILRKTERGNEWDGTELPFDGNLSEHLFIRSIGRHCRIYAQFADWMWEKCGNEFQAAEIDHSIFIILRRQIKDCERRGWTNAREKVCDLLEYFNRERCDSEKSNYCRAHRWGETYYDEQYAAIVKKEPRWSKGTERWHGVFLKLARRYLDREPKWSPEYRAPENQRAVRNGKIEEL